MVPSTLGKCQWEEEKEIMEVVFLIGNFLDYETDRFYNVDQAVEDDHTYILSNPEELRLDHVKLMLSQIGKK